MCDITDLQKEGRGRGKFGKLGGREGGVKSLLPLPS